MEKYGTAVHTGWILYEWVPLKAGWKASKETHGLRKTYLKPRWFKCIFTTSATTVDFLWCVVLNEHLLFLGKHLQGLLETHLSQPWNPIHLLGSWHIGTIHKWMDHVVPVPSHNGKPIHTETFFFCGEITAGGQRYLSHSQPYRWWGMMSVVAVNPRSFSVTIGRMKLRKQISLHILLRHRVMQMSFTMFLDWLAFIT